MQNSTEIAEKLWEIIRLCDKDYPHRLGKATDINEVEGGIDAIKAAMKLLRKEPLGIEEEWPSNLLLEIGFACTNEEAMSIEDNIMYALDTLSDRYKKAVLIRYRDNMKLSECGKELGVGSERARSIIRNAVLRLRHPARRNIIINGKDSDKTYAKLKEEYKAELIRMQEELTKLKARESEDTEIPKDELSIYEKDISEMGLTVRSHNVLKRAGINKIGDLTDVTKKEIGYMRNAGHATVEEVTEAALRFGITIPE